jgi:hypothetical protein
MKQPSSTASLDDLYATLHNQAYPVTPATLAALPDDAFGAASTSALFSASHATDGPAPGIAAGLTGVVSSLEPNLKRKLIEEGPEDEIEYVQMSVNTPEEREFVEGLQALNKYSRLSEPGWKERMTQYLTPEKVAHPTAR